MAANDTETRTSDLLIASKELVTVCAREHIDQDTALAVLRWLVTLPAERRNRVLAAVRKR